jgi:hypothetical protein
MGRQIISPSSLAPAVTITGAQYFYSNKDIPYDAYNDISQSNFFRQLGNSVQRIYGTGEPGSIAELYVNGSLLAEKFVRLDGSYDFGEVQLNSSSFNEIEVLIKDVVSRSIIERQNKTSANSEYILDAGQSIASLAIGAKGNLLNPDFVNQGEAGMILYRYGITDRMTVDVGYLHDDQATSTMGIATSLGHNYTAVLRTAQRNSAQAEQLEFNGYGENWRLSSYIRHQESGFVDSGSDTNVDNEATFANANYYYSVSPKLRLELIGRYQDANLANDISFLKPGFFYSPTSKFAIGARPESDGNYRSELVYNPNRWSRWRLTHQDTEQNLRYDWNKSDNTAYYYSFRRFDDLSGDNLLVPTTREHALGFFWRPDNWDAYKHLRLEASHSDRFGIGGFAEYRTPLLPGVYLDLQVREGGNAFDGGLSAFARIAVDYAVSNGRFIPGKNHVSYNTRGTIAGRLASESGECGIQKISLLVDGISHPTSVQGCNFRLDSVIPGVYTVSLGSEFLPIELIPENNQYIVEIAPSAVTKVDFTFSSEYSAVGKLTDSNGESLANIEVRILDKDGVLVTQSRTDQFGFFRVDGLINGDYILQADSLRSKFTNEKRFTISSDFLFDLNLILKD